MDLPAEVREALTRVLRHIERSERADWEATRDACTARGVVAPRHVYDDALAVAAALNIALAASDSELRAVLKDDNLPL